MLSQFAMLIAPTAFIMFIDSFYLLKVLVVSHVKVDLSFFDHDCMQKQIPVGSFKVEFAFTYIMYLQFLFNH